MSSKVQEGSNLLRNLTGSSDDFIHLLFVIRYWVREIFGNTSRRSSWENEERELYFNIEDPDYVIKRCPITRPVTNTTVEDYLKLFRSPNSFHNSTQRNHQTHQQPLPPPQEAVYHKYEFQSALGLRVSKSILTMDAEWQHSILDEDMSLFMDLNDPFGSIPPEMDLSIFDSYQPADETALTMGDPLLGLAISCDQYLPDRAYPEFLADVTSRTDNSSFPNTDFLTTLDELFVSDALGSSQNRMDHVPFSSGSSLSPGFESTIMSPCITRSPALWHSPELNYMRNNISTSSSAHQYSPLSSATLLTSSPSISINESSLAQKGKDIRGKKSPLRTLSRNLRHHWRPEVCHLCFKRHPYKRELEEHMKVHHPAEACRLGIDMTRPACNACGKTFSRRCNLKRHMDKPCKGLTGKRMDTKVKYKKKLS